MDIKFINIKTEKVAFTTVNREAVANRNLIEGIKSLRNIVMPGLVISSKLMLDLGFKLFNPITKEEVTHDNADEYLWCMVDGQTRYLCAMEINAEDNENFSIETMPVIEYDGENDKINDLIIILNNTGKAWSIKDYTHNKIVKYGDKQVINATYRLMQQKFTVSTISRIIANGLGVIKKDSIVRYNENDRVMNGIDPRQGIERLRLFLEAGFSTKHLKKRYIWDLYNNVTDNDKMKFLNYIVHFTESPEKYVKTIEIIENLKEDHNEIFRCLEETFPEDSIDFLPIDEILDLSENKLEQNLRFIEIAYSSQKASKNTKEEKNKSSKKAASIKKHKYLETSEGESIDMTDSETVEQTDDAILEQSSAPEAECISPSDVGIEAHEQTDDISEVFSSFSESDVDLNTIDDEECCFSTTDIGEDEISSSTEHALDDVHKDIQCEEDL